jgi:N-acetylglutamate synthase-like GNAT family acetyltransferase
MDASAYRPPDSMSRELLTIRTATAADAGALSHVILRALREVNARDYEPAIIDAVAANFSCQKVLEAIRRRPVLVAEIDGEVVGTAGLEGATVRSMFVRPDHERRGIGAALMGEIEALAVAQGVDRLTLQSSITAEGFYRRHGFEPVRDHIHGRERTIVMEKTLGRTSPDGEIPALSPLRAAPTRSD